MTTDEMKSFWRSALAFVAIGLVIYAGVYWLAEQLIYRTGRSNALFKIETASRTEYDWVILNASHAMTLDFADFNAVMERETGLSILNLASTGSGPLYNRFVLEQFVRHHRAKHLLYVVDEFSFRSTEWNEGRFEDAKLLGRTPFTWDIARGLMRYSREEGVTPLAVLDYVTGFSKINNRERFQADKWEGEAQFDRVYRPSPSMLKKRIEYLYPPHTAPELMNRYLAEFAELIALAQQHGMQIALIEMPVPAQFRDARREDPAFAAAIAQLVGARSLVFHDFSGALPEPRYYFDTDHLNRTGVADFFKRDLKAVLMSVPAS
jgi:hypothetical protein